jgi:hypothetical protein
MHGRDNHSVAHEDGRMALERMIMSWSKGNRVTLQDLEEEFGLGELRGSYPVRSVPGFMGLLGMRFITLGYIAVIIGLIVRGIAPPYYWRLAVLITLAPALYGVWRVWRRLAARFRTHLYYLYADGLVRTGWTGYVKDWVLWTETASVKRKRFVTFWILFLTVGRVDFIRTDDSVFGVPLAGWNPRLLRDLPLTRIAVTR